MCALGSQEIDGNWFCQPVSGIQYSNVGSPGAYNRIVAMNTDGSCDSVPQSFSGPLSPLDEEVSFHVRGPVQINEFAVYVPAPSNVNKRSTSHGRVIHKHNHHHGNGGQAQSHSHGPVHNEMKVRQEISATIDGQVVSWGNNYFGPSSVLADEGKQVMVTATIDGQVVSWVNNWFGSTQAATTVPTQAAPVAPVGNPAPVVQTPSQSQPVQAPETSVAAPSATTSSSTSFLAEPPSGPGYDASVIFERAHYYNAASQIIDNVTFLGNYGGQGSGVFDENFGASLAYVNSAGTGGAASSQILANAVIPSDSEVILMRGDECIDDSCGYVRPGSVAYHGFDGADKAFFIDFSMPTEGGTGFNADMPAIWLLNSQIPHTVQYGPPECNCWTSGCGELDIVEALFDGATQLKSTLHTNTPAGDSDYIARPTTDSMKLAVIFSSSTSTINIQVLDSNTEFPATMSADDLNNLCSAPSGVSHFHVAG
ncbi:uncharacterized protein LY89DRAFT_572863 [Mollisia scopiformis]|uniref:glucan endo-1,3-beta-D-glucosidase n=1 Tax=Mollisia scopiformis TaxID=149040 RepID=A0A194XW10_MOLSC|nr:uncharacterized protein LY89DRAFT_572863 [Mollisia scopiformis]KUJ24321.1 hypothetical protein LY89DRAFT_572863 [Mollisia scopiformis]